MSTISPVADRLSHALDSARIGVLATLMARFADYRQMSRPRIMLMSAAAALSGFVLASPIVISWPVVCLAIIGICCLVAASSALNQVMEAGTDKQMNRTSDRPVASGRISRVEGAVLGILAATIGASVLWVFVNHATSIAAIFTMLAYVLLYTPLKRISTLCTTVGAVPGAMPPVLGWLAAGGEFGQEALALFAVFFVWQFPHFLAIGWIYRDDYERAGLKMLPSFSDHGVRTGWIALSYALAFVPVSCLPRVAGLAGPGYVAAALVLSLGYLWLTVRFVVDRTNVRARQLMIGSLICLPVLLLCLVVDYLRLVS
ncbi:MAG: protoheme IX farnesyltransferase [Planctomycetota bacterium]|nr:MAG: protoheme IX farnesyltransferase [Planctomycetota bacterium]